jgi:ATP-dependent RNA helicase SUPV3L1/SUV3
VVQALIPELPDYESIRTLVSVERKTFLKTNGFLEDDSYVRSSEDAKIVLSFLEDVHKQLQAFFKENPSLTGRFKSEFVPYHEFVDRNNVLETIFIYDCLIPEKEMFFFGQDGGLDEKVLSLHKTNFEKWCVEALEKHKTTQELVKVNFNLDLKTDQLDCNCISCIADFRTRLREFIYDECIAMIENTHSEMEVLVDTRPQELSDLFYTLQKKLDKKFHDVRHRLKRSTLNRLENQVKSYLKETFHYPSPLASKYAKSLRPQLFGILLEMDLNDDFITEDEFQRFFGLISSNIWRNDKYISREFKKMVKSVMLLKRKDISSNILNEYLGEFWVHSSARQIKRKIIYHMGPTNSGKTYHAIQRLAEAERGCYLAPLRLLAGELYDTLNSKGVVTTLLTGEEVIENEGSTHFSSTIEMARFQEIFDCVVIDEIQMITDSSRGWAWTRALVNVFSPEVHVCGDPSVYDLVKNIADLCGDEIEVRNYTRMTELVVERQPTTLGNLQKHDALIVFSRRNALRYKSDLERLGFRVSIVYGRLSPEVRREQARKFDEMETDIIVSTDAISMGMNLPIRRIVFSTLTKFINNKEYVISESEIKQIAGRAGRYLRFPTGFVNCLQKVDDGIDQIQSALDTDLEQQTQCMVGPDLDIFNQVNGALSSHNLPELKLSEFLRLFNTMTFQKPFYCVDLKEMIELAEMVEEADIDSNLSNAEIFGFACAPVNLGLMEHVQYYIWILNKYVQMQEIRNEPIIHQSDDIDYLETSIKCVELYQWLSRHFNNKNFFYNEGELLENKSLAIEQLNGLLSVKLINKCSSCGVKLEDDSKFPICEECFKQRRFKGRRPSGHSKGGKGKPGSGSGKGGFRGKPGGSGSSGGGPGKGGKKFSGKKKFGVKRKRKG